MALPFGPECLCLRNLYLYLYWRCLFFGPECLYLIGLYLDLFLMQAVVLSPFVYSVNYGAAFWARVFLFSQQQAFAHEIPAHAALQHPQSRRMAAHAKIEGDSRSQTRFQSTT